jgi:hypothetical protein
MIIATPFRGLQPNKKILSSQNFSGNSENHATENELPKNKKSPLFASGPNPFDS